MRVRRTIEVLESDRGGRIAIGILAAASILFSLWLTRGTTFFVDDLWYFDSYRGLDIAQFLSRHNGHLVLIPRLVFATDFALFGSDFFFLRLVEAVAIGASAVLVYCAARRGVGCALALAFAAPVLFLGAAWDATLATPGIPAALAVALGLGAILAVTAARPRHLLACVLLTLAVLSFSVGLAFAVGVGAAILMRPDRWSRMWVFAIPLVLWGLWRLGDPGLDGPLFGASPIELSNVSLIPSYVGNAAASVAAGVSGLSYDFGPRLFGSPSVTVGGPWGPPLAALVVVGLVLRYRRVLPPAEALPWAVALLALWCSFALSSGLEVRGPDVSRYVFPGAALALPAIAISLSGLRLPDRRLLAVFGVAALCLVVNIFQLRSAGEYLRGHSISTRAGFGAVQLAAAHIDPSFVPSGGALAGPLIGFASRAERYLPAAARIGPIGYPPAELETIDEPYREEADQVLAEAFRLNLQPAELPTVRNRQAIPCERIGPGASIQLPKAGAVIRVKQGTSISLGRFADKATATLGRIPAGASRALTIPTDRSERPWFAGFDPQSCVEVVPLSVPLSGSSN